MDEVELIWRNAVLGQAPNSLLMPPGLLECLHYLAFQPFPAAPLDGMHPHADRESRPHYASQA